MYISCLCTLMYIYGNSNVHILCMNINAPSNIIYPGKMSEPPEKRVKQSDFASSLMSPEERKCIFNAVYQGNPPIPISEDFFEKVSKILIEEQNPCKRYISDLEIAEEEIKSKQAAAKAELEIAEEEFKLKQAAAKAKVAQEKLELEIVEKDIKSKQAAAKAKAAQEKLELEIVEKDIELKQAELKFKQAEAKFRVKARGAGLNQALLGTICSEIGSLLYDFVDNEPTDELKAEVASAIEKILVNDVKNCKSLLESLHLNQPVKNICIPFNSKGGPIAPSSMTAQIQVLANGETQANNHVYPFPFEITTHFPVFFCHPVFADFMDILYGRNPQNPVVIEYKKFMKNVSVSAKKMDECLALLIQTILKNSANQTEKEFVKDVASAFSKLFPISDVKANLKVESTRIVNSNVQIDLAVVIGNFPFIIVEAKHNSYSINAALQGFQYYGMTTAAELIDNDPAFLITLDKGILFLYGIAKVNSRVVSSCLLSLEFTNYHFNIEGFTDTLYRCLSGLYFFFERFKERINNGISGDLQHKKFSKIKSASGGSISPMPLPAIFSVKSALNEQAPRIEIASFERVITRTFNGNVHQASYFKPCVYLVKLSDGTLAVLKLTYNYDIEAHKLLHLHNLAPRLLGYEKICDRYHVILMEYFDIASHDSLFNHLNLSTLSRESIISSLKGILGKLEELGIVHGDFRSSNIIAKRSEEDPSVLEDFKLIDFELSGKVDELYPFVALKNPEINWNIGVNSYAPRKFEHDQHLLNVMIQDELR